MTTKQLAELRTRASMTDLTINENSCCKAHANALKYVSEPA